MAARDWVPARLGDLIEIRHGFPFEGEYFRDEPPGDILLTPGNFGIGGGFKGDKFKYYVGQIPEDFVLREGDLLITMTDLSKAADTLGYPALVPSVKGCRFLHNQRLGKVLTRPGAGIRKDFLYYLLRSRSYRNEVLASATGTTVKHTSPERLKAFEFLLPPSEEQRTIAHILGRLDDKIEGNRRMNETLDALARVMFKSWFVDFDPVRDKAECRQPSGMDAATAALFPDSFQNSPLGKIPKAWQVRTLDAVARFLNGLALQKYPPNGNDCLPVIKIAQLHKRSTEGADQAAANLPPDYVVHDGDVLFSWSGSLEVVIWCGGRGALNQHLFKVTSPDYPKWFYYFWIREHLPEFQAIASGKATTMGHIQRHHLTEAKVLVPPTELLSAMDKVFSPMVLTIVANDLQSRTLASLRDVLLPKLISGEIRVGAAVYAEFH